MHCSTIIGRQASQGFSHSLKMRRYCLLLVTVVTLCMHACAAAAAAGQTGQTANQRQDRWSFSNYQNGYTCENSELNIECGKGTLIHVIRANYGRFSIKLCNPNGVTSGWSLNCVSRNSKQIVTEMCQGLGSCVVMATKDVFGEPCENTYKYLEVQYKCTADPNYKPEGAETTTLTTKTTMATEKTTTSRLTPAATTKVTDPTEYPFIMKTTTEPPMTTTEPTTPAPSFTTTPTTTPTPSTHHTEYCQPTDVRNVSWPRTASGEKAVMACPGNRQGMAAWRCILDPDKGAIWWPASPDLSNCVSASVSALSSRLNDGESVTSVAMEMSTATASGGLVGGDLVVTTTVMQDMLTRAANELHHVNEWDMWTEAMVNTGSNMLAEEESQCWEDLPAMTRLRTATTLLMTMEENANMLASRIDTTYSQDKPSANMLMSIHIVNATTVPYVEYPNPGGSGSATYWQQSTIRLSTKAFPRHKPGLVKMVFLSYNNIGDYLEPATRRRSGTTNTIVNSMVLSASYGEQHHKVAPLSEPILLTLKHIKPGLINPTCAFWNFSDSTYLGQWSDFGCVVASSNATHTVCSCNHLTNFAVLMDITGIEISAANVLALDIITYIGCIVSIGCLLVCFLTFTFCRGLQNDRNTIHQNLSLCLLLAELVFVIGISQTENKVACAIIAGVMHYFFLGAFAWMFLEGLQLYIMLVEVFEAERSRSKYYCLIGYGVPAIIVAISAGVYHEGYGTDQYCWLTTEHYFVLAFVVPVAAVLVANVAFLSLAIYMMCRHADAIASARTRDRAKLDTIKSWVKGAVVLLCLLGLTWLIGFLYVSKATVAMAYIFTILNTLQGVFIFLFHCALNEKVQKEYKKVIRRAEWLPDSVRIKYGGHKGLSSRSPSGPSGPSNYFQKFFSDRKQRKKSLSTTSTNQDHSKTTNRDSGLSGSVSDTARKGNAILNGPIVNGIYDEGIDLSAMDCSVVDSEMMSEYMQEKLRIAYALPKHIDDVELEQCHTLRKADESLSTVKPQLSVDRSKSETNSTSSHESFKGTDEKEERASFLCNGDNQPLLDGAQHRKSQSEDSDSSAPTCDDTQTTPGSAVCTEDTPEENPSQRSASASPPGGECGKQDEMRGSFPRLDARERSSLSKREHSLPDLNEGEKDRQRANSLQRHNSERPFKPVIPPEQDDHEVDSQTYDPAGFSEC
ncbi:PREDICTED: latrophilin-3-like [Priapulus caudatus]|uniref:Latrophilin-3-like n=1 Tax=Priapulus caudatus TaxID=37621 RepID=A0ABM1EZV6_PRICU|nr:PREDICTED: latrophilin-3-like [Priapulus caudatus]